MCVANSNDEKAEKIASELGISPMPTYAEVVRQASDELGADVSAMSGLAAQLDALFAKI